MIVVRYTFYPSEDAVAFKAACVKWRDAHPEDGMRIYNGVTGRQKTVYLETTFENEDFEGIGKSIFNAQQYATEEMKAWWKSIEHLNIEVESRELLRLID